MNHGVSVCDTVEQIQCREFKITRSVPVGLRIVSPIYLNGRSSCPKALSASA